MPKQLWKALSNANRAVEILRATAETPQWARISAAYLGLTRLEYPCDLQLRSGEKIRLQELTDLKTFWQIFLRRVYNVHPGDRVILDLGANVGLFSLYAARCAREAHIFSLEPFPSTFDRLTGTVRDHHLEKRVTCLNYAVTGTDGIRTMANNSLPSQRRTLSSASSPQNGAQVHGKTLQAVMDENGLATVDLLKMDIEGSEYEVLLSSPTAVMQRISRVALEYHGDSAPYSKDQLFHHLHEAGFSPVWDVCDQHGYGVTEMVRRN